MGRQSQLVRQRPVPAPGAGELAAGRPRGLAHAHASLSPGAVIPLAPIGVAEHLVGLGDLPETASGVGVPRVGVGMSVVGQAPVRTGDLVVAGARQHLQPEVKPITIAGSSGSHYLSCTLQICAVVVIITLAPQCTTGRACGPAVLRWGPRKEDQKMLMRTDPFREFDRLTQQVFGTAARPRAMPIDAYRKGNAFYVHFDLPGVDPASIDLTVEQDVLAVKAERPPMAADGAEMIVSERPAGTFTRQLFLGETLDADHIEADYNAGVLTLTIPVMEAAKPRKLAITTHEDNKQLSGSAVT